MRVLLWFVVIVHFLLLFAVVGALFVIPFRCPWYISIPLIIYIVSLLATRVECPLTNLENAIRSRIGMKRIGGFVGNYVVRPFKKWRKF